MIILFKGFFLGIVIGLIGILIITISVNIITASQRCLTKISFLQTKTGKDIAFIILFTLGLSFLSGIYIIFLKIIMAVNF